MADTPKHSVSVAGIVVDDQDRILVIQRRDNGQWEPPGGVLELDETPEEGVRREVFEETGIAVEVERLTGVYKNMTKGVVALVYRCRPQRGVAQPTRESVDVAWWEKATVRDCMSSVYSVRVLDALTDSCRVRTRVHDGVTVIDP